MPLARTTFRPDLVFNMDQSEFNALLSAHLLYVDWRTLYVNFLDYSDGPPAAVTNVQVVIKDGAANTVQAASGADIQQVGAGAYLYRWYNAAVPDNGTYSITWTALDADSVTCTATDSVLVTPTLPGTLVALDSFNRSNRTGLGTADVGGAWTLSGTSWNISSGQAVATVVNAWFPAWLAIGATDVTVRADFNWSGTNIDLGLIARVTDADNCLFLDLSLSGADLVGNIFKRAGGSTTALGTLFTIAAPPVGLHTVELVCSGSTITAYVDGVSSCTGTDTTQTGTGAGFAANGGSANQNIIDNFSVTTP